MKKIVKQNKLTAIIGTIIILIIAVISFYIIAKDRFYIKDTHINIKQGETYIVNIKNKEKYVWTSINPEIATVKNGEIIGQTMGLTTIKVVDPKTKNSIAIIIDVKETKASSLKINKEKITLSVGMTELLTIEVLPLGTSNKTVSWESSDVNIATVENGVIRALKEGNATVTITTNDKTNISANVLVTVTKPAVLVSGITLNKSANQLSIGSSYTLTATVSPGDAVVKNVTWISSNPYVASVNNGTITAIDVGTSTITATSCDGSNISSSMTIVVVPKTQMIDITNKTLVAYKKSFTVNYPGTSTSHLMQNFAITNIGTENETYYFSTATRLRISNALITDSEKEDIVRTVIIKMSSSSLYTPTSNNIEYMYLNNAGHAQSFDIEPSSGYFWTNNNGYTYCAGSNCTWLASSGYGCNGESCKWWGHNTAISRIKYTPNQSTGSFTATRTFSFGATSTKGIDIQSFYDWDNDLMAVKNGTLIKIYRLSDAKNGKLTQLYSFNVSLTNKYVPSSSAVQGHAINGGYYYQYKGSAKENMYIEVYNMLGELQYVKTVDPGYKNYSQEAEGIKIYNNTIYIGFIHREISSKTPVYYAIYRMQ